MIQFLVISIGVPAVGYGLYRFGRWVEDAQAGRLP